MAPFDTHRPPSRVPHDARMGPVFSSCGDEPPQSNQKPDMYEGFDDDQLKLIKAQKTISANAPGVVQVTSGPDESQEPAPGTMEFMPVKTFTSSKPVRDPKTGGITSAFSKDFRSGKVLGTGGFAVVKQCTHIKSGKPYAVKVMNIAPDIENEEEIDGMTLPEIAEEIRLTMAMAHPQVVRIYDFYQTDTKVYVVMELLRGGELLDAGWNWGTTPSLMP